MVDTGTNGQPNLGGMRAGHLLDAQENRPDPPFEQDAVSELLGVDLEYY